MKQDPAKAAKARALVASLLIFESVVIASLGVWLIVLTVTADSVEIRPLLGELIFIVGIWWIICGSSWLSQGKILRPRAGFSCKFDCNWCF